MEVVNDNTCSWINDLSPRGNIQSVISNLDCEWLVIGAGYTGLSAARKLGQLYPNQKIILVDAQLAGEGASSRNSGYLVDTTLNDGFTSEAIDDQPTFNFLTRLGAPNFEYNYFLDDPNIINNNEIANRTHIINKISFLLNVSKIIIQVGTIINENDRYFWIP